MGQVGEEAGEARGPYGEVGDGGPHAAGGPGVGEVEDRCHESEISFVGFVLGQEVFADFGDVIEREAGIEIGGQVELGLEQVAGIEVD